jgi:glycyl-tRNA synthetase
MYIVKKIIKGKEYYYLNKAVREDGKVKSKNVAYLGKDKQEAEAKAKEIIEKLKNPENKKEVMKKEVMEVKEENLQERKTEVKKEARQEENKEKTGKITIDELATFCKEKGFVFRSSEIYGGMSGFWDFGPLGVELFSNIKKSWWDFFVKSRENMVGIQASVISHPKTWEASGHLKNFNDLMVYCRKNKKYFRVDHVIDEVLKENVEGKPKEEILNILKENKKSFIEKGYDLEEELKAFSLMFKTHIGTGAEDEAYLRGETAQGMFLDFKAVQLTCRKQLPFGIAQIGRCFRNEIAPRDFLFRSREFHIGEFEFFINLKETKCDSLSETHKKLKIRLLDSETQKSGSEKLRETTIGEMLKEGRLEEWHAYWLAEQVVWFNSLGLTEIKIREHTKEELSHYSSATFDIDYEYPFGSKEVAGNANRGQYDLTQHEKFSGEKMAIRDDKYNNKEIPRVIEPTFGMERVFLAILTKSYNYDKERDYVVLKIPAKIAPIQAAVFPIVKQPQYMEMSENIVQELRKEFNVIYDKSGSVGRRYARNDETGTAYCITIDELSGPQKDCTIRDRDTTKQIRVKIADLREIIRKLVNSEIDFASAGELVETRKK